MINYSELATQILEGTFEIEDFDIVTEKIGLGPKKGLYVETRVNKNTNKRLGIHPFKGVYSNKTYDDGKKSKESEISSMPILGTTIRSKEKNSNGKTKDVNMSVGFVRGVNLHAKSKNPKDKTDAHLSMGVNMIKGAYVNADDGTRSVKGHIRPFSTNMEIIDKSTGKQVYQNGALLATVDERKDGEIIIKLKGKDISDSTKNDIKKILRKQLVREKIYKKMNFIFK